MFRYRNDRCLYFFGVKDDQAFILLLNHGTAYRKSTVISLAQKLCPYKTGEYLTAVVEVNGKHIRAGLPNGVVLEADDATFTQGRIGLLADVPTRYAEVTVTMSAENQRRVAQQIAARNQTEERLQAANPRMVVWKQIGIGG